MLSIKLKINLIDSQKQQLFIPEIINVMLVSPNFTPNLANTFGSISPIYQATISPKLAQIGSTLFINLI